MEDGRSKGEGEGGEKRDEREGNGGGCNPESGNEEEMWIDAGGSRVRILQFQSSRGKEEDHITYQPLWRQGKTVPWSLT